jgi:hypothetical protein
MISLGALSRPNTATIFADDPAKRGKLLAFVLTNVSLPSKTRGRFDLLTGGTVSRRWSASRSPLERFTVDDIKAEPLAITISGSVSATPLELFGALGTLGSIIRRDLAEASKLAALFALREPLVVVTPWGVFPSMHGSIDESHGAGNKVDLTISLEEIRIVSQLTIEALVDLDTILAGGLTETDLGIQPVEQVTSPADLVAGGLGG